MEVEQLIQVLRATLEPDQRVAAEKQLTGVFKASGFTPTLLHLVMSEHMEMAVRQAGVVYLKNMVSQYWEGNNNDDPAEFVINDNDKQIIRENLIEAVIASANIIRVQLSTCVNTVVKYDFPDKWPTITDKIISNLQSDRHQTWLGSLICLYQLVKNFEYKRPDERQALDERMKVLLPLLHHICTMLLPDASELSVQIQKHILKVFYSLIQYYLPMGLITRPIFTEWMELAWRIIERPVPEECNRVNEDSRPDLIWWNCKKWSMHILTRCFHRYGSPGNTADEYNDFSNWFLQTFSEGIIQAMLRLLEQYCNKQYLPRRLLQMVLNCITLGVNHAVSWKVIQPNVQLLIQGVIFPLLCHSAEDEELWQSDPVEYVRTKFDVYEEFFNPSTAAQTFVHDASLKRVVVLHTSMAFLGHVLTPDLAPPQKSGALHMLGALAEVILQKSKLPYKDQAELILVNYVFPELSSQHGFLRAKACWVIRNFSQLTFNNMANLVAAVSAIREVLHTDKEVPVRVEAAIALQMLLRNCDEVKELLKQHIQETIGDLLHLIRETENDDLTCALQRFVCTYSEEIAPLAVEVSSHLASTFMAILESTMEGTEDKSMAVMGVLNTLETICSVMEDQDEILPHIEGIVVQVIGVILQQCLLEFIEEMLSLIYSLTTRHVSPRMWLLLPHIHQLFHDGNSDFFVDMAPTLYNYITVEPAVFLSTPYHMEIVFSMCKSVLLTSDLGEDAECHAAKLLEVVLLQYKGQVDHVVLPFVDLMIHRLRQNIRTRWLKTMCLHVIIAAIVYNPAMVLPYLDHPLPGSPITLLSEFLRQWLSNGECLIGLHDRKLFIVGLSRLLCFNERRPHVLNDHVPMLMPVAILVLKGLQRAFEATNSSYQGHSKDDSAAEEHEVGDEDDVVEVNSKKHACFGGGSGSGEDDDDAEETALESFETELDKDEDPVHEYKMFRGALMNLRAKDPAWYQSLMVHLNDNHKKDLDEIFRLADPKRTVANNNSCLAALLSAPVM